MRNKIGISILYNYISYLYTMSDNKQLLQYLGCGVIAMTVVYITFKLLKYHTTILEGMENNGEGAPSKQTPQQIAKAIKTMTDKKLEELAVDNNRQDYEDIIINFQELIDANILYLIVKQTDNKGNHTMATSLTQGVQGGMYALLINSLSNFKHTLTKTMQYLDSTASGGIL